MLSDAGPQWLSILQISALAALGTATPISLGLLLWQALAEQAGGYVRVPNGPDNGNLDPLSRFTADILSSVTDIGPGAGKSINVEEFWKRVKLERYLYLLGQVAASSTEVILAHQRITSAWTASNIIISFVRVLVSIYAVVLALHYSQARNVATHTRLTHHVFVLSALSIALTYFCTFGRYLFVGHEAKVSTTEYATLGLALIQTAQVGFIPLRPDEYQDLRNMYSMAVVDALAKSPQNEDEPNVTSERGACIFSMLTQTWALSTVRKATQTDQLDVQDLGVVQPYLRSQNIVLETMDHTNPATTKSRLGPLAAVVWAVWSPEWVAVTQEVVLTILISGFNYLQHICLQQFLWSIDQSEDMRTRMAWASAMIAVPLLSTLFYVVQDYISYSRLSPRMTAHASLLLFMKLLTRNTLAAGTAAPEKDSSPAGAPLHQADVLNLISNEAMEIRGLGMAVIQGLEALVSLAIGSCFVCRLLGASGVIGLSSMLFVVIPAYFILKQSYRLTNGILKLGDERVALLKEAIQAIAMIKMMAAERFWFQRISRLRDRSYSKILKRNLLENLSSTLFALGPELLILISFAHYTLVLDKDLTPDIAFTAIAVFGELRPSLAALPETVADLAESLIACRRITDFLGARDVDYLADPCLTPSSDGDHGFRNATVGWDIPRASHSGLTDGTESVPFRLRDLTVTFPRGELTLITGRFGSGKTLMLLAVLGEASLISGEIRYAQSGPFDAQAMQADGEWVMAPRGVAYAPQTTWLQSKSIRDNILFGLPMHVKRYRRVVHATGLLPDLEILEDGDLTEIGERGKILSGGQKARDASRSFFSLARAVYSRASTVILDDVMSAVDAQTAQHIVQYCFSSDLMADRTVIIASHAVEALAPLASHAIFLQEGRAIWQGTGAALLASKHMAHLRTDGESQQSTAQEGDLQAASQSALGGPHSMDSFDVKAEIHKTPRQLIVDEERRKGTTELRLWKDLAKQNGGSLFWLGIAVFLILTNGLPVIRGRILEDWSGQQGKSKSEMAHFVILFSSVSLGTILTSAVYKVYKLLGALRAIRRTFQTMLESLLRAKMPFFTKTRAGSIIQRFGPDLRSVQVCSGMIAGMANTLLGMVVALVTVTIYGGPLFFAVACCVFLAVIKPSQAYRTCSRQIQRLQAIVPGPILSTYGETIAGTAVIRAFGAQSLLFDELLRQQNMKMVAFAWRGYVARWWYVIMRFVDLAIVSSALGVVILRSDIDGAAAGFILTFAGMITKQFRAVLLTLRQIETSGVNLERVAEFCALEKEEGCSLRDNSGNADDEDPNDTVAPDWPTEGRIEVQGLCARYAPDMPDIMQGVTFSSEGGERIGIVGATGGGKSTLAKAFFSFVDLTAGTIKIDGQDIATLPLRVVRSRLGIIAQDPILLSGSLRLNLDIDGKRSDAELYDALRQVHLIRPSPSQTPVDVSEEDDSQTAAGPSETASLSTTIAGSEGGKSSESEGNVQRFDDLDYEITAGGENLSAGQKQLIVLARALLKNQKILILDEATASIDSATDAEISRIVHQEFQGATVLIIAHRLRTIMPCRKILVMENGRLIQQGPPLELIHEEGKFRDLCTAAGPEEFGHLLSLAEKHRTSLLE